MKKFFSLLLSLFLWFSLLCSSVFAEDLTYISYDGLPSISKGSDIPWGDSIQINIGTSGACIQGYKPTACVDTYYPVCEKIGLFNHVIEPENTDKYGALEIRWLSGMVYLVVNGTTIQSYNAPSATYSYLRYGVVPVKKNGVNGLQFVFLTSAKWDSLSDYNYLALSGDCSQVTRAIKSSPYTSYSSVSIPSDNMATTAKVQAYGLFVSAEKLTELGSSASLGDNNVPSDPETGEVGSSLDTYFDYMTTCPACGSRNVSYNWNFIASAGSALGGANAYTFKCNDCGEKWYNYLTPAQHEAFESWLSGNSLVSADPTLPLPSVPTPPVQLPSDISSFGDYINYAFSSLQGFASSFNGFFQAVLGVLPAPVLSIIILGVGFVVVLGILKVIRG